MVVWCSVVMECEGGDVAVDGVASWGKGGEAVEVRVVVRRCDSGDGGCGGVTRVTRRRWWCGGCSGDGAVVVVVVMLVEMAWSLAGVRGGAGKGGGAWYSGSGRSGHEDNIWFRPERSPENFSGGGVAGDGVAGIKRRRRDLSSDGVKNLATASGRDRLKEDLESSTWRRRQDYKAANWLERLPARSITTWEDLTTRFLAQFFPPGRIAKLRNDILMFQQHHGESLSEAWTRFKDLLQKVPHHGIDLWLQDLAFYDNESWNDPMDFSKLVKAICLPQDVPSKSDYHLIELENQVQRLMEAHLASMQPTQVNKVTTLCEICSGPHDTQYCLEDPKQAFVEYASSRNNEIRNRQFTTNLGPRSFEEATNTWKDKPNFNWERTQSFTSPQKGSFSTYSSSYSARLERTLREFDSHQERR
ncbi:MAK10-like protein [Tanacetum coccineum]